jgi:hypothetical protein
VGVAAGRRQTESFDAQTRFPPTLTLPLKGGGNGNFRFAYGRFTGSNPGR